MYDIVVKNGLIVDGSGMPGYRSDLGIKAGKVAHIGRIEDAQGSQIIDAEGCVVAPGFIDPHTHFDAQLLWDGEARPALPPLFRATALCLWRLSKSRIGTVW